MNVLLAFLRLGGEVIAGWVAVEPSLGNVLSESIRDLRRQHDSRGRTCFWQHWLHRSLALEQGRIWSQGQSEGPVRGALVEMRSNWVTQSVGVSACLADSPSDRGREEADEVVAEQHASAELLGSRLQAASHVDVGAEVRRIDFVITANRALNRPPHMQTESQSHLHNPVRAGHLTTFFDRKPDTFTSRITNT